jgi:hypothetical protein
VAFAASTLASQLLLTSSSQIKKSRRIGRWLATQIPVILPTPYGSQPAKASITGLMSSIIG